MGKITGRRLCAIAAFAFAFAFAPATATAAVSYHFDPTLSLTGDCSQSSVDPVPDPGVCPIPPGIKYPDPGAEHPGSAFTSPRSVATDFYGDIYVVSFGNDSASGAEGRIDIFAPDGSFLTEVPDPFGPKSVAVDKNGNLYVFEFSAGLGIERIRRFEPSAYEPATGTISYEEPPAMVTEEIAGAFAANLAIDAENNHLFVKLGNHICEFKPPDENNEEVDCTIGSGTLHGNGTGLALDVESERIYATDYIPAPPGKVVVRVFALEAPHALIETIEGSTLPQGKFVGEPSLAVNEETGDLFTFSEEELPHVVNRLTSEGVFISQIGNENGIKSVFREQIGLDNGPFSPNRGYLFVPSHPSGTGHSLAFGPSEECEPVVESLSFAGVSGTEAQLLATVKPCNAVTSYSFELTTQQAFEAEGFEGAEVVGQGQLPAVNFGKSVAAPATGLSPETAYRLRIQATNATGSDEAEDAFSTYPLESPPTCPGDPFHIGLSANLPDCRAYELVTPPDTNSRTPVGWGTVGPNTGIFFPSPETSPAGESASFMTTGGSIPGLEGTGSLEGDSYLATRGPGGWSTAAAGPTGAEAEAPLPGSASSDQGYSFWGTAGSPGTAGSTGVQSNYVRYPDGHSALIGRGSLGTDVGAAGKLITEGGGHIVFASSKQLEPSAAPTGTATVYDRTVDGVTHVVSLLPENETPEEGESAKYLGASLDGSGVAFSIGGTLYLRRDNTTTYEVGSGLTFAGVAEGGGRIFYLEGGNLKAFDAGSGQTISFTTSGNATPVNVAADGASAYFVSPSILPSPGEPAENPEEASPVLNAENLYLSREGAIAFVGTVTERDVEGELRNIHFDGLGLWTSVVGPSADGEPGRFGADPSRTTPDGSTLLFQSRADLTGYDPGEGGEEEHAEVYRYDAAGSLACLSCNPTGASASGEASLETVSFGIAAPGPFNPFALVRNLRDDGRRAFFQSTERLVPADSDGLQDVYEWEAQGVGSCGRTGGCLYLISSGHSFHDDYLYAVSDEGNDVFFRSPDLLLGADSDETPSIYDARVEGGFPEGSTEPPCEGEGCRSSFVPAPTIALPAVPAVGAEDNVSKRCPKGKRPVKRHGTVHCVKTKHRKHGHKHRRRAGAGGKGGAK